MRTKIVQWVSFVVLALLGLPAFAQGTAFTYQGRLNTGATPANGSFDFVFALYDAEILGNRVGIAATNLAVPVNSGVFTATLDFGGAPWNGQALWLEILVRTNGAGAYSVLTPLQQVNPTPYAIAAGNLTGTLPAAKISGTVGDSSLPSSPNFSGTITAASFSGSGANLSGVNAASLGGVGAANLWQLTGNAVLPGNFLGSTNNTPVEIRVNNSRVLRAEVYGTNQAPNIIGGASWNQVSNSVYGAVIGGGGGVGYGYEWYYGPYGITNYVTNVVNADYGVIVGGGANTVSAPYAFIGGGNGNLASGELSVVCGGWDNIASGSQSFVGGGGSYYRQNLASGGYSGVVAGVDNQANGSASVVVGGWYNSTSSNAYGSFVGAGYNNMATNSYAMVVGGEDNVAGGLNSFAAGNNAQALHNGSFVWADGSSQIFASTGTNQFLIRATNGVGINTTTPNATLTVNGTASKPGGGSWSTYSDVRLKKNVESLSGALDKLLALRGVTFEYIDPAKVNELGGQRLGMIAQEVEKVFPDWVDVGPDGYKRLTYRGFEALAVEALRQLRAEKDQKVDALEKELQQQKNAQTELQNKVDALMKALSHRKE